jgi:predicted PurR-regulated permease PerM
MKVVLAPLWANPYLRFLILTLALLALGYLFWQLSGIITAFLVAFLIAYLLNPVLEFFARSNSRTVGMLVVIGLLLLILAAFYLLWIYISSQFARFALALPVITSTIQDLPYQLARRVDPSFGSWFEQIYTTVKSIELWIVDDLVPSLFGANGEAEAGPATGVMNIANWGGQVGIGIILSLYLLYDYPKYVRSFLRIVPHRYRPRVKAFVSTFGFAIGGFVRGQSLDALITGVVYYLLMLLIGVPLAPVLGIIYGVANFIPFFGPIIAATPTIIFAFLEGGQTVVLAIGALILVNQIDGNLLTPYIFSRFIALDPVTIIVAIFIGGALFGFAGLVLAIPLAAFFKLMVNEYYVESTWYKLPPEQPMSLPPE